MTNYWEKLKEAYADINSNQREKAEIVLNELYRELISLDYEKSEEGIKANLVSCILWLGEINMKKWNFEKAIEYYDLWNKITDWKDFNILFNLWVVYRNSWQEEKSGEILKKAKKIEPNNPNLIRFLKETGNSDPEDHQKWKEMNASFLEKIEKIIEKINK